MGLAAGRLQGEYRSIPCGASEIILLQILLDEVAAPTFNYSNFVLSVISTESSSIITAPLFKSL